VQIPEPDRLVPAPFIATVTEIPIDPTLIRTKARIVVNERAGIIAVTGNVELGPVGVSHRGMKLTSATPSADPREAVQPAGNGRWAGLDTSNGSSRTSTQLLDLLGAFDRLSVPVEDQIAIIYELKKTGALHAEIVSE
jgi:flagellar basal body P-ring protein FlgI